MSVDSTSKSCKPLILKELGVLFFYGYRIGYRIISKGLFFLIISINFQKIEFKNPFKPFQNSYYKTQIPL